jgi:hypothetical protein
MVQINYFVFDKRDGNYLSRGGYIVKLDLDDATPLLKGAYNSLKKLKYFSESVDVIE